MREVDRFNAVNRTESTMKNSPLEIAIRRYETAHAVWMNTSIFQPVEMRACVTREKDEAKAEYVKEYEAANPTHFVIC